ncbi:MAG: 4-alpha-glucanotransferase [Spirochaetota bacterium]
MLFKRKSGILIHISSLPSHFGIGDLGPDAYKFAEFLKRTAQRIWQVLPLTPTRIQNGNSPYNSPSAFAGNQLLISPVLMMREGYLSSSDIENITGFPCDRVDYPLVVRFKEKLFKKAFNRFISRKESDYDYSSFCGENAFWLRDYALFEALSSKLGSNAWNRWPQPIRDRRKDALIEAERELRNQIEEAMFLQYLFFKQWSALKGYCNSLEIQIMGDIPLYVNYASSDVWAHPDFFKLTRFKTPRFVSGVPPDYFSINGQLWGNPIYHWERLKGDGYSWWVRRIEHNLRLFDWLRLDHFRGFAAYWEVGANQETARKGKWVKGPGDEFFNTLLDHFSYLPFVAEDLGHITPDVRELRDRFGFPGMRILQFAFDHGPSSDLHKPHNYPENCVAYTGTHDNQTLMGWILNETGENRGKEKESSGVIENALRYVGHRGPVDKEVRWEFIRTLMVSRASLVILPMQDVLGLGGEGRMNRPSVPYGNWEWRMLEPDSESKAFEKLLELTELYGRS